MSSDISNITTTVAASSSSSISESYNDIISEKAEALITGTKEKIQSAFVEFYGENGSDPVFFVDLFVEMTENTDFDYKIKCEVFQSLSEIVYFYDVMEKVFEDEPIIFIKILSYLKNNPDRQSVVNYILERQGPEAISSLVDTVKFLLESEEIFPILHIAIAALIGSVGITHQKQFAKHCAQSLSYNHFAQLIAHTKSYKPCVVLITHFFNRYYTDDKLQEKAFYALIETIAGVAVDEEVRPIPLSVLLDHRDNKTWIKETIIKKLDSFENFTQILVLMCMNDNTLYDTFQYYGYEVDKLNLWLEGMMLLTPSHSQRYKLVRYVAETFELDDDVYYDMINKLIDTDSIAIKYLYTGLPRTYFSNLLELDPSILSSLLIRSLPSNSKDALQLISHIHQDQRRTSTLFQNFPFKIDSDLADFLNFMEVKTYINQALESDQIEIYQPIINDIPPFIIALAMLNDEHRDWLIELGAYMNEKQLKTMTWFLSLHSVTHNIDRLAELVRDDQIRTVLNELSYKKTCRYLSDKTVMMIKDKKRIKAKEEQLQADIDCLKRLKDELSPAKYHRLYEKAQKKMNLLYGNCRKYTNSGNLLIKKITVELLETKPRLERKFGIIPKIMDFMEGQLQTFRGPSGYFSIVETLQPVVEEEEISDSYWELIKYGDLVHLRTSQEGELKPIEHPGKLLELGISSDKDFELLGLSHERRVRVDKCCTDINKLSSEDDIERRKLVDQMLQIVDPDSDFPTEIDVDTAIDVKTLLSDAFIETEDLKDGTLTLLRNAMKVPLFATKYNDELVASHKKLTDEDNPEKIRDECQQCWNRMIETLKSYHQQKELEIHRRWEVILHPELELEGEKYHEGIHALIKLMNINSLEPKELHVTLLRILDEILTFTDFDRSLEEEGRNLLHTGEGIQSEIELKNWSRRTIGFMVKVIKTNDFLVRLQKYLKQPCLKSRWGGWGKAGVKNIRGLVELFGIEGKPSLLFDLRHIASLMEDDTGHASSSSSPGDDEIVEDGQG